MVEDDANDVDADSDGNDGDAGGYFAPVVHLLSSRYSDMLEMYVKTLNSHKRPIR